MKRDESIYLQHILDAIAKVESYLQGVDETAFSRNTMAQDAVIRQIEIIGEATKHLSDALRSRYAHIPWLDIVGMRDKLIHEYDNADLEEVWKTATVDIPRLLRALEPLVPRGPTP